MDHTNWRKQLREGLNKQEKASCRFYALEFILILTFF